MGASPCLLDLISPPPKQQVIDQDHRESRRTTPISTVEHSPPSDQKISSLIPSSNRKVTVPDLLLRLLLADIPAL